MGLTIHYTLSFPAAIPADILIAKTAVLHQMLARLPCQRQTSLMVLNEGQIRRALAPASSSEWYWACVQFHRHHAYRYDHRGVPHTVADDGGGGLTRVRLIPPRRLIGFTVEPSPGCEDLNLFIPHYPASFIVDCESRRHGLPSGRRRLMLEHRDQWAGSAFCKTQYASLPEHGGVTNFLRAHLIVIAALDAAKAAGFGVTVNDESGYWIDRSIPALVRTVGEWNGALLGLAEQLRARFGSGAQSAITLASSSRPIATSVAIEMGNEVLDLIQLTRGTVAPDLVVPVS